MQHFIVALDYVLEFITIEMLGSSRGNTVKQASIEVLVSLSTLRITIGSSVLQNSVKWVSVLLCMYATTRLLLVAEIVACYHPSTKLHFPCP